MSNILIVEDDKYTNEIVSNFLKSDGHNVVSVENGKDALTAFNDMIEVVILDIMLPDMNGIDILDKIRKKNKEVIIVILSAITDEITQLISYDKKVDEYVEKPFSPALLVKKVNTLINRISKNVCENIIYLNGYKFNYDRYIVERDGIRIHMTVKEMEIIRLLYNRRECVLSRQQILDGVWNDEEDIIDRTVDVHIRNIRKKTFPEIIETIKGIGYRLNESN